MIAICLQTGDKWQSKTLFLAIFDLRSPIVKSIFDCHFPVCYPANSFCPENVVCFLCMLHIFKTLFRLDFLWKQTLGFLIKLLSRLTCVQIVCNKDYIVHKQMREQMFWLVGKELTTIFKFVGLPAYLRSELAYPQTPNASSEIAYALAQNWHML